jgi:GH15 family glucan-1,4-alpha-glucosidase
VTVRKPLRREGYLPISDYAAIGDGRTVALVGLDGSIDWLCLPNLDSESVFAALLDAERGGSFQLAPDVPYEASGRYLEDTNVLETTFSTADGTIRVTDALTLPRDGLAPGRELARRVECLSGRVPVRWRVRPRFGYGFGNTRLSMRDGIPVGTAGADAVSVRSWELGDAQIDGDGFGARTELEDGARALVVLGADHQEPLVFPSRDEAEQRLDATAVFWKRWAGARSYGGPWRDGVLRSALALKLLVYAPSGAYAAAPTTSLPETPGGERNWDYRYCWVRDSAFAMDALLELGCEEEAHAYLWWLLHASQLTHPKLQVLYQLDGGREANERELPLAGYAGARPVRVGNGAADQLQLDVYGDLFEMVWLYVCHAERELDRDTGKRLAKTADLVAELWREKDSGIWEVRGQPMHYTQSKAMCWVALDRACRLAERGQLPSRGAERWRAEAEKIRQFVEERCWSGEKGSYVQAEGSTDLDASILLALPLGFGDAERMRTTVDTIRRELADGPLVWRYRSDDSLEGEEGAFLACSFWLVQALAVTNRGDEASELMEELLPLANDVGLYSEEMDGPSRDFLGNFPQALTHLALIEAALAISRGSG